MQIEFRKRLAFESKSVSPLLPKEDDPLLKLYYVFDDSSKSKVGNYLSIFITLVILVSVTCFIIESLPAFRFWTGGVPGSGQYKSLPIFGQISSARGTQRSCRFAAHRVCGPSRRFRCSRRSCSSCCSRRCCSLLLLIRLHILLLSFLLLVLLPPLPFFLDAPNAGNLGQNFSSIPKITQKTRI